VTTAAATPATDDRRLELTARGIVLGALITLVFTAANVYFGLKAGLTFASSIPAAVISMAVLRSLFRNATIWENNIVQTIASAAGTLSSIVFVLPGLVMVGWWTGFPFWASFGICVVGGILGVMYSVPLRRAMVTGSDLPYPEGVAAAEVLEVGSGGQAGVASPAALAENRAGFAAVVWGSLVSAGFAVVIAMRVFASDLVGYGRAGVATVTGFDIGLSFALLGIGHLVGLTVGIAMLSGIVIAWAVLVPAFSTLHPAAGDAATIAGAVFHTKVRFVGAGAIGVAALWSLGRLARPVVGGVISSLAATRARETGGNASLPITERDIPFNIVIAVSVLCLFPLAVLLGAFLIGTPIASAATPLIVGGLIYIVIAGIFVAAVCGYMAGLIGSSNSPVSGLGILTILGASLLLLLLTHPGDANAAKALVAFGLFVTAIIINVATISNDNLQDLKTGQLVGATPWRQQVALIIGVIFGSLTIPPVLNLLNQAYGFAGSPMHGITSQALSAPQATLISALAQGVIAGQLDWNLIGIGALIGLGVVAIDEILRRTVRRQFPPLAVALGIYLPMAVTFMVVVGAVAGKLYNDWVAEKPNADVAKRLGILLASGLIVGESLLGIILSAIIVFSQKGTPFAVVGDDFETAATWIGGIAFVVVVVGLYRWVGGLARKLS
jgi:putative OPT family oligopeptide transporter